MVRDTSIATYRNIIDEGIVGEKQIVVLEFLERNPNSTDKETSVRTGLNINCVTGRRNELVDYGIVEYNGKRKCTITHRTVYQWHIKEGLSINRILDKKSKIIDKITCPLCKGEGKIKAGQTNIDSYY